MARKQSAADRQKRLDEGRCPIHGIGLGQISSWYEETDWIKRRTLGRHFALVNDGRSDCPLVIKAYGIDGPWELLPEWEHVLGGESDDDLMSREDLMKPAEKLPAGLTEELPKEEQPTRYSMVIQWSDSDGVYSVTLPEWEGYVSNPIATARTYAAAAYEGYFALRWLIKAANPHSRPFPVPLTLDKHK